MILYPWVILIMKKELLIKKLETIREDLICLADLADSITDGNVASGIANELDDLIEALVEAEDENEASDEASVDVKKPALYKGTVTADLGYISDDGERYQDFTAYFTSKDIAKKETHKKAREFKKSGLYDSVKESVTVGKEGDWKYEE